MLFAIFYLKTQLSFVYTVEDPSDVSSIGAVTTVNTNRQQCASRPWYGLSVEENVKNRFPKQLHEKKNRSDCSPCALQVRGNMKCDNYG